MRDERKYYNNNLEMYLWAGLALLGLHLYVELGAFFANMGLTHPISAKFLNDASVKSKVFSTPWPLKLVGGACIVAYGATSHGVKSMHLKASAAFKAILIGLVLYIGSTLILTNNGRFWLRYMDINSLSLVYLTLTIAGMLYLIKGSQGFKRLLHSNLGKDRFNRVNETFPQEERRLSNPYSVNIPTDYEFGGWRKGWLNISAPFRGTLLMGSPGSGKTFSIVHPIIRQHIEKGLAMYVYDFKYPSLTMVAYNAVVRHQKKLPKNLKFYSINFDDPAKSHRANPLHPDYLPTIIQATETAKTVLLNLNRKWIERQGEYFVESPVNYLAALIWFLRTYDQGQYCTFPHLIELVTRNYRQLLAILMDHPDLAPLMIPFVSAYESGAVDQLEGQISSSQIALARLASPALYWTMSGNDFSLDINNPEEPKVLCLGNNATVKDIYGAALGLYNFRVLSLINKANQHPSSLVVDELPTIYFKGISELIQTARSNQVAVTIGLQDFSLLEKDYGRVEAEAIRNTCGNIISGQVYDKTAEAMQNRLGKNVQQKENINVQSEDTTHGFSTELNWMVPAAKMGQLTQGWMAGVLSDNIGQESDKKAFHARVAIDIPDFEREQKAKELPNFSNFANDKQKMKDILDANYLQIKDDITQLVASELARLNNKYRK